MIRFSSFLNRLMRYLAGSFSAIFLAMAALTQLAVAADSFVVKDIRIEGLQRVEPGTVFSYLPVQVGERFTPEKAADSIKALYATGFFRDVQIQAQGDVLIVIVDERPTISRIEFTGMKEFDPEVVRKSLPHIQDPKEVSRLREEIRRGFYGTPS